MGVFGVLCYTEAMKEQLFKALSQAAISLGIDAASIRIDYPEKAEYGDFATNVALANAKKLAMQPRALAEKIIESFKKSQPDFIESVSIAGAGFINFAVKDSLFAEEVAAIAGSDGEYGWGKTDSGKKIMVEYTDPNPFKEFHIGHLMSNAIGESISRLIESQGASVKRANWQGDVGPHVAKALWGAQHIKRDPKASAVSFWGKAYVAGATAYDDPETKKEIDALNKKVYDRSDAAVNALYDKGRTESLAAFEDIYKKLGTKFDNYFFEGIEGRNGEAIVREFQRKGVFEESEGAVIFKGEDHGLHTRVFITSQGLPTYETKELGLNKEKFKIYPDLSESVIITGNEQSDYFKVLMKVFSLIDQNIASKTKHMSHGLMRFATGKMSSRKGNVITAESLLSDIKDQVMEKIADREFMPEEKDEVADMIAVGAIKYTILRQAIGGDVIFDSAASISFEGDSGPYLQYSAVRAKSILEKAKKEGIEPLKIKQLKDPSVEKTGLLERLISRFPDIVARARAEYAPQHIAGYLIALAGAFNGYYAGNTIVDAKDPASPYRVALTKAFLTTMTNGLWLLGIKVPKKM